MILLDVLSPESYRRSHLPGAINIPLQQIGELATKLLPNKDQEIVVYCAGVGCDASEKAAMELSEIGYSRVRLYGGGKGDWIAAGLPLASDEGKSVA